MTSRSACLFWNICNCSKVERVSTMWDWMPRMYTSPVPDCLCTSVATLPTYVRDRHSYMCTLTERWSIFHKTTRYSIVFFRMIPIITPINATVASNSLPLKHKHFQVHQLLALLKRCNKRVQPSYKQMLLWLVAIHKDHTHVHTYSYDKVRMHGCVHSIQTFGLCTHVCMYLFIGMFTLHQNAHQVEANQKHIESILFTLFSKIHGQCALYVLMVMQLLRVIKWPTCLSFYCCVTALGCT